MQEKQRGGCGGKRNSRIERKYIRRRKRRRRRRRRGRGRKWTYRKKMQWRQELLACILKEKRRETRTEM